MLTSNCRCAGAVQFLKKLFGLPSRHWQCRVPRDGRLTVIHTTTSGKRESPDGRQPVEAKEYCPMFAPSTVERPRGQQARFENASRQPAGSMPPVNIGAAHVRGGAL
jgi:hypothetical protein